MKKINLKKEEKLNTETIKKSKDLCRLKGYIIIDKDDYTEKEDFIIFCRFEKNSIDLKDILKVILETLPNRKVLSVENLKLSQKVEIVTTYEGKEISSHSEFIDIFSKRKITL